jgi:hypothetical protein
MTEDAPPVPHGMCRFGILLLAAALGGCASDSWLADNLTMVPQHLDTLDCAGLVAQYKNASARLKELNEFRDKSGNPVVNAIVYDSEYASVRAKRKYAEEAAGRKGCDLAEKSPAKPPETSPPEAQRPRHRPGG